MLLIILIVFPYSNTWANDNLINQSKTFYVNDNAGVLSEDLKKHIVNVNANFENTNERPQVVVSTVKTLNNMDINEYAYKLFEKFKIGNKDYDNGILILLAPNERKIRIEVGYGLEGCITDSKSGMIMDSVIDLLSNSNYNDAISVIFDNICNEIAKEYGYDNSIFTTRSDIIIDFSNETTPNQSSISNFIFSLIFIVVIILDVIFNNAIFTRFLLNILSIFFDSSGSSHNGRSSGYSGGGSFRSSGGGGRSGGGGSSRSF